MIVMVSNNGLYTGYLAGKYPGQVGHLYSPGGQRGPYGFMPYALDNGKFPCWSSGKQWDAGAFMRLLDWAKLSGQRPRWVIVPDEVANAGRTIELWAEWSPIVKSYGWPLAFAAQDGHSPEDVPKDADVVFIGGTSQWKSAVIKPFCSSFERVHVGRVNGLAALRRCAAYGVESCDGTGWFRGDKTRLDALEIFLEEQNNGQKQISTGHFLGGKSTTPVKGNRQTDRARALHCVGENGC